MGDAAVHDGHDSNPVGASYRNNVSVGAGNQFNGPYMRDDTTNNITTTSRNITSVTNITNVTQIITQNITVYGAHPLSESPAEQSVAAERITEDGRQDGNRPIQRPIQRWLATWRAVAVQMLRRSPESR